MALSELVDLAAERVGGAVLFASDEFFASRENLIKDAEAVFDPHAYVPTGKLMDGWESRRRRADGHDRAIVRLGLRGVIRKVVVDTAFFRGNYPAECALEACDAPVETPVDVLEALAWREILPRAPLGGDRKNIFAIDDPQPASHVRLRIYPDGGVARLRVLGDVAPAWDDLDLTYELVDLAAIERGGRVIATSDMFFGDAQNMLLPGRSTHMGDGWETKRRRGPGHDWSIARLGAVGRLARVEIDTQHFKGNAPGAAMLEGCRLPAGAPGGSIDHAVWSELLPRAPLLPHTRHVFDRQLSALGPLSHVRISIFPDGGVARLRLWGRSERAERLMLGLQGKNAQPAGERAAGLLTVCRSRRWADALALAFPFVDPAALVAEGERLWRGLDRADWLEAFAGHPRIGESGGGRWSAEEQSGTIGAAVATRRALAEANQAYEARFGHVFLVCATGKTAAEMLRLLESRMDNSPERELEVAGEEQRKITRLRLIRWLSE